MNGDGRVVHRNTSARALAWRCATCTRLSVRMEYQDPPAACDHDHTHLTLERIPLHPPKPRTS